MMSKEEYEEAFTLINLFTSRGCDEIDCDCCAAYDKKLNQQHKCKLDLALDMFENLINERFELQEKYSKVLDDVHDYRFETHCMKMTIRTLCKHFGVKSEKELQNIYLNKPYKFEDLKVGMWIWIEELKECNKIRALCDNDEKFKWVEMDNGYVADFEEHHFFPMQMANVVLNNG